MLICTTYLQTKPTKLLKSCFLQFLFLQKGLKSGPAMAGAAGLAPVALWIGKGKVRKVESRELKKEGNYGVSVVCTCNVFLYGSTDSMLLDKVYVSGVLQAAPILFSFQFPVCNARPIYRYIYIYI